MLSLLWRSAACCAVGWARLLGFSEAASSAPGGDGRRKEGTWSCVVTRGALCGAVGACSVVAVWPAAACPRRASRLPVVVGGGGECCGVGLGRVRPRAPPPPSSSTFFGDAGTGTSTVACVAQLVAAALVVVVVLPRPAAECCTGRRWGGPAARPVQPWRRCLALRAEALRRPTQHHRQTYYNTDPCGCPRGGGGASSEDDQTNHHRLQRRRTEDDRRSEAGGGAPLGRVVALIRPRSSREEPVRLTRPRQGPVRPRLWGDDPLNLSILISGGKETNRNSPSKGD